MTSLRAYWDAAKKDPTRIVRSILFRLWYWPYLIFYHHGAYRAFLAIQRMPRRIWARISALRPLITQSPVQLSRMSRAKRSALLFILALPDRHYRGIFVRFGQAIRANAGHDPARQGVLMMIGSLGPGGAERQVMLTLLGLAERGSRPVSLACTHIGTPTERFFLPQLEAAGIPVRRIGDDPADILPDAVRHAIDALPGQLHQVRDYAATFAAFRPEVAHLWLDEINVKGGVAAVATGVPRIVLGLRSLPPWNFNFHHGYMREGYRWLARQPGVAMVCNSKAGARSYESWLGLQRGRIKVIPNGFPFDLERLERYRAERGSYRARLGIPADAPVLGVVFRMSEEKRPLLWLEIAAALRRRVPEARFLIVGDGSLRAEAEARASLPDLAGAVYFAGHEKDALKAMVDMDLFLLTSRAEGLPNVLVEAQSVGVPAITTKVGGAPETIMHGKTGWVLNSEDSEQIGEIIAKLLRDTAWRAKAGTAAMEFSRSTFGIDRAIDATLDIHRRQPSA